jgi:hypothetical protein
MDHRRLYLGQACSSLYTYCIERLGYSEDAALRRVRVARLAERVPRVLDELRSGAIHLSGLFLLSQHLTTDNAAPLLAEARHRSKREIERLIACWFPRPDVPDRVAPVATNQGTAGQAMPASSEAAPLPFGAAASRPSVPCPGAGTTATRGRIEPLSAATYRVEVTVSAELRDKLERARELVSHSVPGGELSAVLDRALDALIDSETRRRLGAGRPRKARATRRGSRHVPVAVARRIWERDAAQCTFHDAEGRRCSERRFLTIEHRRPFALGGPPTVENLCLLCAAHNRERGRAVFGESAARGRKRTDFVARDQDVARTHQDGAETHTDVGTQRTQDPRELWVRQTVLSALCQLGFRRRQAALAIDAAVASATELGAEGFVAGGAGEAGAGVATA